MKLRREHVPAIVAAAVWLVTATVYRLTLAPSVPFWDPGESIACSYILGIPHPPGTPLYMLLGRLFTLFPFGQIVQRVNAMCALASTITVTLTYLCSFKVIRLAQRGERKPFDELIAHVGAVTGALLFAFSHKFWENSVETEVYCVMSLGQILVFWLGLRWWEEHAEHPTAAPMLVAIYVMWLSVGLQLGVALLGAPLIVLLWLVDRRAAVLFAMPSITIMLVTMGMERMVGGVLLLSTITFLIYASQRKLDSRIAWISALAALPGMYAGLKDQPFHPWSVILAILGLFVPLVTLARKTSEGKILALALALMVLGYSTHAYLPIRAAQHPAINEGDPSNWSNFKDLLERKQYGTMNMFERRAPWSVQLNKEFWRYFRRQWPLFGTPFPTPVPLAPLLPMLLGVAGAAWHWRREKTSWCYVGAFFLISTGGLIIFLNFSDHEVRDRDYFFQSGYHAFAIWIALGVAWVITWVRDSFPEASTSRRWASVATAALLFAQVPLLLKNLWYTHDRHGDFVAHDYAYNMLAPLKPNSFMFTNGDNDTFPLWYIQQVEGFRKDVRLANLSLLNTDWYIRQLRDEAPKLPIQLDDETVKQLGVGAVRDASGRVIYTNEFMVHHLLDTARRGEGWSMQPYFAVTVPEHYGYDKTFTLEGLVYRVNRDTLQGTLDVAATVHNLYHVFKYRGLFEPDGSWDTRVYKDENATTLSRNYGAAHIQLAYYYHRRGQLPLAVAEMERVERMFPDFTEVLVPLGSFYMEERDTAKAVDLFRRLASNDAGNPEAHYYYGVALVSQGHLETAIHEFDTAIRLDPDYPNPVYAAYYALADHGETERANTYLSHWIESHPQDAQSRELLEGPRAHAGADTGRSFMPQSPLPPTP